MNVSKGISGNLLHEVFIEAATQAGHKRTEDVNGYQQEGFGRAIGHEYLNHFYVDAINCPVYTN